MPCWFQRIGSFKYEEQGGYVVSFTADQLKDAPADSLEELTKGDGRAQRDRAFQHYGTKPYWN